jgi:hypothetical protein
MSVLQNCAGTTVSKFEFGMDTAPLVESLHQLADSIEKRETIPVEATTYKIVKCDDYTRTVLLVKFTEAVEKQEKVKELVGPDSKFPVDVVKVNSGNSTTQYTYLLRNRGTGKEIDLGTTAELSKEVAEANQIDFNSDWNQDWEFMAETVNQPS